MQRAAFLFVALALAACSSADEMAADLDQTPEARASAEAGAKASAEAQDSRTTALARESDSYELEYAWPTVATAHEGLVERFRTEAAMDEAELAREADAARADAQASDFPFRKHAFGKTWKVVADTPDWLSLSAELYSYSGGAHPNSGFDALVWSKRSDSGLDPLDFFRSPGQLENAVARRFCEELNGERARRRGQPVAQGSDDSFDACPGIEELTVLLGSNNGKTFTRIGLLAAPYVAGPYAEGPYEVTLNVDTSVLDAVKPEYVRYFALAR